jgi:hypothetical protein
LEVLTPKDALRPSFIFLGATRAAAASAEPFSRVWFVTPIRIWGRTILCVLTRLTDERPSRRGPLPRQLFFHNTICSCTSYLLIFSIHHRSSHESLAFSRGGELIATQVGWHLLPLVALRNTGKTPFSPLCCTRQQKSKPILGWGSRFHPVPVAVLPPPTTPQPIERRVESLSFY